MYCSVSRDQGDPQVARGRPATDLGIGLRIRGALAQNNERTLGAFQHIERTLDRRPKLFRPRGPVLGTVQEVRNHQSCEHHGKRCQADDKAR